MPFEAPASPKRQHTSKGLPNGLFQNGVFHWHLSHEYLDWKAYWNICQVSRVISITYGNLVYVSGGAKLFAKRKWRPIRISPMRRIAILLFCFPNLYSQSFFAKCRSLPNSLPIPWLTFAIRVIWNEPSRNARWPAGYTGTGNFNIAGRRGMPEFYRTLEIQDRSARNRRSRDLRLVRLTFSLRLS